MDPVPESSRLAREEPEISIRHAEGEGRERALRLVYEPPGPEAAGVLGDEKLALEVGACLHRAGLYTRPGSEVLAACSMTEAVGVLVGMHGPGEGGAPRLGWAALVRDLASALPARSLPRALYGGFLRSRLGFPVPEDAFHVIEVHVAPRWQRRGIGAALLRAAEKRACALGCGRLSLTTLTTNPARRLYERLGYRVVGERRVAGYERLTGSPGRVQMEKQVP